VIRLAVRPDTHYISQGRTVLATKKNGFIDGEPAHGLFVHETRLLSKLEWRIDGELPETNAVSNVEHHSWMGYYLREAPGLPPVPADRGSGQVPGISLQPVELRISRSVGEGLHEDVDLTNFARGRSRFTLSLHIDGDFADQAETRGERITSGRIDRSWESSEERTSLTLRYSAEHQFDHQESGVARLERGAVIELSHWTSPPRHGDSVIDFEVILEPGESWHLCLDLVALIDGEELRPSSACFAFGRSDGARDRKRALFLERATSFQLPFHAPRTVAALRTVEQARDDLASLRLYDLDLPNGGWTMAAGLPLYIALYGRDTLTTGWQAALLGPEMMMGTLPRLAEMQGTVRNDWRDEEPGRMIHEAHTGPLSTLNHNPRARSYGSITTSGLFAFIVAELWHWTGDETLVRPLLDPALRALQWLDEKGDLDGDGFYEYLTRSVDGVRNQGWKDSNDAIPDTEGKLVDPPIATCEEQGFVYIAKLHLADVLWWLGDREQARRLFHEAGELKKRFNEKFWMEEEGFFALGLDAQKRPIRSITSNPGHCIATAIADSSLVERTAERMFAPDLFSGWGIRTLSSDHPRYNPYSYHLGSVWPVEQGTFAMGFMRYGLFDRAQQLAAAQFDAAALFELHRLPELFSGHPRDERHPFPAVYPNSNSPQAWSSSSVFSLLQSLLGLYPYARLNLLLVDPHLPEWLPEITLTNLRVGKSVSTIRFYRKRDGSSSYRLLRKKGKLHVVRQATPWSLTATFGERLHDWLVSLLPGK
jgi:glycogen debranching enzyme